MKAQQILRNGEKDKKAISHMLFQILREEKVVWPATSIGDGIFFFFLWNLIKEKEERIEIKK